MDAKTEVKAWRAAAAALALLLCVLGLRELHRRSQVAAAWRSEAAIRVAPPVVAPPAAKTPVAEELTRYGDAPPEEEVGPLVQLGPPAPSRPVYPKLKTVAFPQTQDLRDILLGPAPPGAPRLFPAAPVITAPSRPRTAGYHGKAPGYTGKTDGYHGKAPGY